MFLVEGYLLELFVLLIERQEHKRLTSGGGSTIKAVERENRKYLGNLLSRGKVSLHCLSFVLTSLVFMCCA